MIPTEQRIKEITWSVCVGTGISLDRVCGPGRTMPEAFARFILCHELRGYGLTLQAIGQIIGRGHAAVRYCLEQYDTMSTASRMFRDMVAAVNGAEFDLKIATEE